MRVTTIMGVRLATSRMKKNFHLSFIEFSASRQQW
jgi:hypothetical protein